MGNPGPKTIGFLGGTFDPPHKGHIDAAKLALEYLSLEKVLFVVAGDPWQKELLHPVTPARIRLEMLKLATSSLDERFEISDVEIKRKGPSYTAETLEELRSSGIERPYLIIGSDLLPALHTWHRFEALPELCELCTIVRLPSHLKAGIDNLKHFKEPAFLVSSELFKDCRRVLKDLPSARILTTHRPSFLELSSSLLRAMIGRGEPVADLVGEEVERFIKERGLYG